MRNRSILVERDRRIASVAPLLFTLIALGACVGDTAPNRLDVELAPAIDVVLEARIGSVDDSEIGFSQIRSVDIDRDGAVYVLEGLDQQIRVYSPEGALLRTIGRRGEGPGELQRVSRFGVVGDTVWTFDYVGDRITLFRRSGELLSTGRADGQMIPMWSPGFGHVLPWEMRPDGLLLSRMTRVSGSRNNPAEPVGANMAIRVPVLLFDGTGSVVDTVGMDPAPPPRMARPPSQEESIPFFAEIGGRPFAIPRPPTELPQWVGLLEGRIEVSVPHPTGDEGSFHIARIDHSGDTIFQRTLFYRPGVFTDADLDALAEAASGGLMRPGGGGGTPDPEVAARLRAEMVFPERRPLTQGVEADDEGRLWIKRDLGEQPRSQWILLDASGIPMGRLELPASFRMEWSRGSTLWGVERDELDVPWLVRYRIGI